MAKFAHIWQILANHQVESTALVRIQGIFKAHYEIEAVRSGELDRVARNGSLIGLLINVGLIGLLQREPLEVGA